MDIKKLKSEILGNLDFLPSKLIRRDTSRQMVTLQSNYECGCGTTFSLNILLEVSFMIKKGVRGFSIQEVLFFKNTDDYPGFDFTLDELTDYIDY